MDTLNQHSPVPEAGDWVSLTAVGPHSFPAAAGTIEVGGIYEVVRLVNGGHGLPEVLIKVGDGKQAIIDARHGDSWEIASAVAEVRPIREEQVVRYSPEPPTPDGTDPSVLIPLAHPDIDVLRAIGLLRYGEQIDTDGTLMEALAAEVFARGLIEVRGAMRRTAVMVLPDGHEVAF